MTGEAGAVTRICDRLCPLPIKVFRRLGLVECRRPAGEQVQRVVDGDLCPAV